MAGIAQGRLDFSLILQGFFHYSRRLFHHEKLFFHYGLLAILLAIENTRKMESFDSAKPSTVRTPISRPKSRIATLASGAGREC